MSKKIFLVFAGVFVIALITLFFNNTRSYAQIPFPQSPDFDQQCRNRDGIPLKKKKCFCRAARNFFDPYKSVCPVSTPEFPFSVVLARYDQCMSNSFHNLRGCLDIEKGSRERCEGEFLFDAEFCKNSVMRNQCPIQQRHPFVLPVAIPDCSEDFIASHSFSFRRVRNCVRDARNSVEESVCDDLYMNQVEGFYQKFAECYNEEYNIPAV